MMESCEQTGHRRMITSALASAQSAFNLLCAAESGIKTIVQMGLCPGYSDRHKILPRAEPSPLSKISPGKEYRILRRASYLHQPPSIGRLSSGTQAFARELLSYRVIVHAETHPTAQYWSTSKRAFSAVFALLAVKHQDAGGCPIQFGHRAEEVEGSDTMFTAVHPWQYTATL